MPMIDPIYSLSGFFVGMLVGMTGVGGGSLMTPLLILLFGVNPATAVGTDLLYAAATKTAGSLVHGIARSIDWRGHRHGFHCFGRGVLFLGAKGDRQYQSGDDRYRPTTRVVALRCFRPRH